MSLNVVENNELNNVSNGGNADTVDGKHASDFVNADNVLTTKEQIEANTDVNNVASSVITKEILFEMNNNPKTIISGYTAEKSISFDISKGGSYLIVVLSNNQSAMAHNVYIASRQVNSLLYSKLSTLLSETNMIQADISSTNATTTITITTKVSNGMRITVTRL